MPEKIAVSSQMVKPDKDSESRRLAGSGITPVSFESYARRKVKETFAVVRELSKAISGVELNEPRVRLANEADPHLPQALVVYRRHDNETGEDNTITFYPRIYGKYLDMVKERAEGRKSFGVDWTIAHEVGHALVHYAIFERNIPDRALDELGKDRLNEATADLIGAYVSMVINGMPATNTEVAKALLRYVSTNGHSVASADEKRLGEIISEVDAGRYGPKIIEKRQRELNHMHGFMDRVLTAYGSPELGYAKLLLEESAAPLTEIIKLAFAHPKSATGIMDCIAGSNAEEAFAARERRAGSKMREIGSAFRVEASKGGYKLDTEKIAEMLENGYDYQERQDPGLKWKGKVNLKSIQDPRSIVYKGSDPESQLAAFLAGRAYVEASIVELRAMADEADAVLRKIA